jgi:RHS repeat-associated protein
MQLSLTNTFTYDGLGSRLARTVNGQARRFVLDRLGALTQVLVENDTNNSPVAYYVYGLGLAGRISSSGTVATYHFNIQGSTVALTDSSGKVTDSYAYDSFGVLANSDGDSPQPFRYLGLYGILDDSAGLLYARARYFSPQLGRFLTKDAATSKGDDGQTLNRFVYALNNPLRFRDATGLVATEGSFWPSLSSLLQKIIVPEQAEVLNLQVANSTPRFQVNANHSGITIFFGGVAESIEQGAENTIGKTGDIGEEFLKTLGGIPQKFFRTTQGARFVDQYVDDIANEAKVGYQSLTTAISRQIAKDAELIESGQIQGATWNFFRSPKTGKIGPSQPLRDALQENGININEFDDIDIMF